MKYAFVLLIAFIGCNQKDWYEKKPNVTHIISGDDTIVISGHYSTNMGYSSTSGHYDTSTEICTIKFTKSFKKDTVYITDTFYTKELKERLQKLLNNTPKP